MKKSLSKSSLALLLLSITTVISLPCAAMAQEGPLESDTAGGFYGSLTVGAAYDENIYRVENDPVADSYLIAAPTLYYLGIYGKHRVVAEYEGAYGAYNEYNGDNYADTKLGLDATLDPSPILDVNLGGSYDIGHEGRGKQGSRFEVSTEPDFVDETNVFAKVTLGRQSQTLQFGLRADSTNRIYNNNEQSARTRRSDKGTGEVYYNIGQKTSFVGSFAYSQIDYTEPDAYQLDSIETYTMLGAVWRATGKTTGEFRIGYMTKDLDNELLADYKGLALTGRVIWKPISYSKVVVALSRTTEETPQYGTSYYVQNRGYVAVEHELTDQLTALGNIDIRSATFSDDRVDTLFDYGVELRYDMYNWLSCSVNYLSASRNSTAQGINYTDNIVGLAVTVRSK
jgi:hypothetical protein